MRLLAACVLCLLSSVVLAQPAVATFTDFPKFENIKISPKGTYLAFTEKSDNREFLVVVRAADLSGVSKTGFGSEGDIDDFDWVNDERILVSPARKGDLIDFKAPSGEIFGINADGSNFEILFGIAAGQDALGRRVKSREAITAAGRVVDLLPDDDDHVIVQSIGYGIEADTSNQAWLMDVNTGRLKELLKSPIRNGSFITDANHQIRFVIGTNTKNIDELYVRTSDDKWQLLYNDEDTEHWVAPFAPYGKDGKMLVQNLGSTGTRGIAIWDPVTGEKQDLFHDPVVDVSGYYRDNDYQYWAFEYIDHFPNFVYPDESHPFVALHKSLRATFKGYTVRIVDETDARDKVIVHISAPQFPGDFLVMDTKTSKFLMRLPQYPNVPKDALSPVDPIEFKARDGQSIRGYLTIPVNTDGRNLPMVVLPHGGPHGIYDTWGYDFETQLLASRGYAVLQVNFRGSGGRGEPFEESGYGQWGGRMQDDITDATRWVINDGVADPGRICIYGGSYGAYAALTGAFREPDLYKCAIGMSGIYDLNLMFTAGDISDARRGLSYLREVLGEDKSLLDSRSPVENADKIRANVMLIHGKLDVRAPFEHAERLREALRKQGREVTWLSEYGESHGIFSEQNRVNVYEALLAFLEKNIGK